MRLYSDMLAEAVPLIIIAAMLCAVVVVGFVLNETLKTDYSQCMERRHDNELCTSYAYAKQHTGF